MKPRIFRLSYLIWIVFPLAIYGAYTAYGLPHMIWNYSWIDEGQGMDPFADRYYTDCTFIGPYGVFSRNASNGRCGFVAFFKNGGA